MAAGGLGQWELLYSWISEWWAFIPPTGRCKHLAFSLRSLGAGAQERQGSVVEREGLGGLWVEETGPFPQGLALSSPDMKQEGEQPQIPSSGGACLPAPGSLARGTIQTPLNLSALSVFSTFVGPGSFLDDLCSPCALCPLISFLFPPVPISGRS